MADEQAAAEVAGTVTMTLDGIDVVFDQAYARSWDGLRAAARMQSSQLPATERFLATVDYYGRVCPNIDDVVAALQEARPGDEVTGNDVMSFVARAIKEGVPKN